MRGIKVSAFGGPEVLTFATDLPPPPKPTGKQVLVRVKSIGVNPVDTYIRKGDFGPRSFPFTPGCDGAGIVEEVGNSVKTLKKGDRVYWGIALSGSYAELVLTSEDNTFLLHEGLSFQQGAAIGVPYSSAYRGLVTKARLRPGQTVLVHGASGAVGIGCCQIARSLGAFVIGTAGTKEGMQLLLSNGAHFAFNHREPGYIDKIETSGKKLDIIVEMLANVNLQKDLELVGYGGQIVIVGSRGKVEITPIHAIFNEISIHGLTLAKATEEEWKEMGAFFRAGQEQGWLRPIVGQQFTLEQAKDAHIEVIEHNSGSHGKVIINV